MDVQSQSSHDPFPVVACHTFRVLPCTELYSSLMTILGVGWGHARRPARMRGWGPPAVTPCCLHVRPAPMHPQSLYRLCSQSLCSRHLPERDFNEFHFILDLWHFHNSW